MPSRTTTSTLTWEAPPTATRSTNGDPDRFKAEADQPRARPGNWAVLTSVETGSQFRGQIGKERRRDQGLLPVRQGLGRATGQVTQPGSHHPVTGHLLALLSYGRS